MRESTFEARSPLDGRNAPFDVIVVSCPRRDADSHCRSAMPHRSATPASALALDCLDDAVSSFVRTKGDEHMVDDDIVQDLVAGTV
jgi:hypothetical protein